MKKIYIKTFGCQMNEYDSDKMADVLNISDGLVKTDTPDDADVILFNTCSVREKAQEKVFHDLGRVRHLKKANPNLIIGVGGCVASQEGAAIVSRAPFVDVVFGPQTLHRLPELIAQRRATGRAQVDISFPEIEKFDHLPPARVEGSSAFVSIMEGCSKYCTFCVVPYTRGEEFSRPFDDVIAEVVNLANGGVKEVTLLGQNVNAYQGTLDEGGTADFAYLLEMVHELPGIERIRYTTSHPREMTQRLIDCYGTLPKLVSHLHLPVQSGSDPVLAAMKRGHTVLEFKSIVRRLREQRPDLCLSSDFIIGFPGETEADFEATMRLIQELDFDASFSFIYSKRPGTPASSFPDDVTPEQKSQRLTKLQAQLEAQAQVVNQAMIGTVQRVLVEGHAKKNTDELAGRTDNNRIVNFAGQSRLIGQFVEVTVTQALSHSLRGEIVTFERVSA
ncbi:MAG: tRNA (N6-isopentenyl adenosine(37)-C2)-methylthiotransferase MiaB [Sulfuriferula multivorans]|uniref:tRNA-2-methylthio-N(6)-dimethylallyladenosine synthase n=1 Tax=Sulfuriferula multivorans TaxID=1559896 RepID=A0A7C9K9G2_9PROT|nr:tRNA (N6-isopentenyl adenosine(37)-C2)-methylthiotransferase MiaB [Sulfuriferula multivorans]